MVNDDLTIPAMILRRMIRAFTAVIALIYFLYGINFLLLPLSITSYGGVFTNHWFWGVLFLIVSLGLSHGVADPTMGKFLTISLVNAAMLSSMWMIAVGAASIIGHINYISPFIWFGFTFFTMLTILAQLFANPKSVPFPQPWIDKILDRLDLRQAKRKGEVL